MFILEITPKQEISITKVTYKSNFLLLFRLDYFAIRLLDCLEVLTLTCPYSYYLICLTLRQPTYGVKWKGQEVCSCPSDHSWFYAEFTKSRPALPSAYSFNKTDLTMHQ